LKCLAKTRKIVRISQGCDLRTSRPKEELYIHTAFPAALEEAKIEGYTWHCNRHTFASRLVMAGVDLWTVAELLGHKMLQMVMRYSHLAPEHQASAVDRLVKTGDRRDTKSDTRRFAAKAVKRLKVASN
jgi:integrase